ncbi:MAG: hypothetical protein MZU97_24935 [Bacillus subtilis]|nr:hypothetical protein [Bacillus subtilis]
MVSIAESVVTLAAPLLTEEEPSDLFAAPDRGAIYEASYQIIELSSLPEGDLDASIQVLVDFVQAYNDSIFVQTANLIVVPEISGADVDIPLHLHLFDSVISFPYGEDQISRCVTNSRFLRPSAAFY